MTEQIDPTVPQPSEDGVAPAVDETVTAADLVALHEQLGREARGVVGIAARCVCGRPLVVRTAPRLENGTPFPTTFYLTHPALVAGASTLEANGVMREMSARLLEDEDLAVRYRKAHEHYLAEREALNGACAGRHQRRFLVGLE